MTMKEILLRYKWFLPVFWIGSIAVGLGASMPGSTLPYLAARVSQSLFAIGFIMTARSVGYCFSSFATGFIFYRLGQPYYKLLYLATGITIMAMGMFGAPLCRSFALLVFACGVFGMGTGMFDTGINSLLIYIFGPVYCPPIIQFNHFGVAMGGFLAPLIARPFLIELGAIKGQDAFCMKTPSNITDDDINANNTHDWISESWPPLVWPYIIIIMVNGVVVLGLLAFIMSKIELREFEVDDLPRSDKDSCPISEGGDLRFRTTIMVCIFVFYFMICGKENMFWSHAYSFAICSKLQLDVSTANTLNTVFFVGFLAGRGSGVFIAHFCRPRTLLVGSLTSCLVSSTIMSIWGESNEVVAFVTFLVFGYAVAMIFGSGISWIAARTKVTGAISSIWFIGAYIGISVFPPLAGALFSTAAGAMGLPYLAAVTSFLDLILFGVMSFLARYRNKSVLTSPDRPLISKEK